MVVAGSVYSRTWRSLFNSVFYPKFITFSKTHFESRFIQSVQLKSGPYFNMSNLFTKIYDMLYYTTKLYLQ